MFHIRACLAVAAHDKGWHFAGGLRRLGPRSPTPPPKVKLHCLMASRAFNSPWQIRCSALPGWLAAVATPGARLPPGRALRRTPRRVQNEDRRAATNNPYAVGAGSVTPGVGLFAQCIRDPTD